MIGEIVYRLPYASTTRNAHGAETHVRGAAMRVEGAAFDPGGTSETADGGQRITTAPTLYVTYDQPAHPLDQWRCRGNLHEVVGDIPRWLNPYTGSTFGAVITLRRVTG